MNAMQAEAQVSDFKASDGPIENLAHINVLYGFVLTFIVNLF